MWLDLRLHLLEEVGCLKVVGVPPNRLSEIIEGLLVAEHIQEAASSPDEYIRCIGSKPEAPIKDFHGPLKVAPIVELNCTSKEYLSHPSDYFWSVIYYS
jgi:hypothetical protein